VKDNHEKSYWPHMIMGFLLIGIVLAFWTVKTVGRMPVSKEDRFMMDYQNAELHYNDVMKAQQRFKQRYDVALEGVATRRLAVQNSKANPIVQAVILHRGANRFAYRITDKAGHAVADMNVTFVLTRPHTHADDVTIERVPFVDGAYRTGPVTITKPGRYTLKLRAAKGDAVDFDSRPAFLEP